MSQNRWHHTYITVSLSIYVEEEEGEFKSEVEKMSFQLVLRPPLLGRHLVKATPIVATGYSRLRIRNCLNMDPHKSQKV